MSRVRIHNFSISLDGFGTGEDQTIDWPAVWSRWASPPRGG